MNNKLVRFKQIKALDTIIIIASYLPFIGIILASNKQIKNKLYGLWHWFIITFVSAITFVLLVKDKI